MPVISDDDHDDEDWYDSDEPDDGDPVACPECGRAVYDFLDKCPACGYWLSGSDRQSLRPRESKPRWVLVTALVLLIVLVLTIPGIWELLFG
jgi:hypothetical protein